MGKVTLDLEGIKPIPRDSIELDREIDNIKEFGVDGIRGINESWDDYSQRIMAFTSGELRSLRLKALRLDYKNTIDSICSTTDDDYLNIPVKVKENGRWVIRNYADVKREEDAKEKENEQ